MMRPFLAAALACMPLPALAHDAPSGWHYPWACCSDKDCSPLDARLIKATPQGWYLTESGETVAYTKTRASPDGEFHRCVKDPADRASETLCLFVPPMGM